MAPLPALATVTELEDWLLVPRGSAPAATVTLALTIASGLVRDEARCTFARRTDTFALRIVDGVVRLPGPVVSVTAVTVGDQLLTSSQWELDGDDLRLRGASALAGCPRRATVTWTHGFAAVPATVKGLVLDVTARCVVNPKYVRQESTGQRSVTFLAETASTSLSEIEKDKLARYRDSNPVVRLGR
ncbi:hypothetical protein [Streptomyces enissocaesilis]|uniref:Lipoprotein n=1 Tax=Streptomyces enissocaesilis TaxID=332589 RepID=A0ABP6K7Y2_9ACTN